MSTPIVVTGAAGFIGRNVVAELNHRGHQNLLLVDLLGTTEKWANLVGLAGFSTAARAWRAPGKTSLARYFLLWGARPTFVILRCPRSYAANTNILPRPIIQSCVELVMLSHFLVWRRACATM